MMPAIDATMNLATMNARALKDQRAIEAGISPKDVAEIKKSAQEFESIFTELLLKSMRDTVPKEGLISGGNAEDVYRSMLDSEYAKVMAEQHSTGLAETITRQLLETMKQQSKKSEISTGVQAYQRQADSVPLQSTSKQGTIDNRIE